MARIFLISDNHFGSRTVISVFHRPFRSVEEMDRTMIDTWNSTVGRDDTVFSLGDFIWDPARRYVDRLNGNKILIWGNHDWGYTAGGHHVVLEYKGRAFYLVHQPEHVPEDWEGWIIHGHHHRMPDFPFIDGESKTINVACELVDYTPVDLDWVLSLDLDTIVRMETAGSIPVRHGEA